MMHQHEQVTTAYANAIMMLAARHDPRTTLHPSEALFRKRAEFTAHRIRAYMLHHPHNTLEV